MTFSILQDPTAYKIGNAIPSGSVLYTGAVLEFLNNASNPIVFPCNGNLNQVINLFDQAINNLLVQNNLTQLTPGNLEFNPAIVQVNQLHQIEINAINALQAQYVSLSEMFNNLNVGNLYVYFVYQLFPLIDSICINPIPSLSIILRLFLSFQSHAWRLP